MSRRAGQERGVDRQPMDKEEARFLLDDDDEKPTKVRLALPVLLCTTFYFVSHHTEEMVFAGMYVCLCWYFFEPSPIIPVAREASWLFLLQVACA